MQTRSLSPRLAEWCAALVSLVCAVGAAAPEPSLAQPIFPGPQPDGTVLLPNQWSLNPVGRQIPVGDFPVQIVLHPAGRFAAVLHSGHGQHEIVLLDLAGLKVTARVALTEAFYGLVFSGDGQRLYASGAGQELVHQFDFRDGYLLAPTTLALRPAKERGVPAGLAMAPDGRRLFAANLLGQTVSVLDLADLPRVTEIPLTANSPGVAATGAAPAESEDDQAIAKRARALLDRPGSDLPYPYACVVDAVRQRLYVSLWGQAAVQVIDLEKCQLVTRYPTEEHPNELLLTRSGRHLLVANANRNTVTVIDAATGGMLETLVAEMEPASPPGSTPNSLALSPDEHWLFVANANINAVAVFDVERLGQSRAVGFIPVGWYPTSVRVSLDGKRLLVANGKGIISRANRHGPQPGREPPASVREYIGGLLTGSLSVIDLPDLAHWESQLRSYTARAYRGRPPRPGPPVLAGDHPIPVQPGDSTPMRYCVYILKENRTYDQVLGDLPQGNGDPSLCLFPERVTPNHHKLAREFVLLDNFYVESEVSADGHEWSVGAYATDYVEKMWPLSYGHNTHGKYAYPSEGRFPIATPAGGYLWDRAREAGVTYRSYGEFVNNGPTPNEPCTTFVITLQGHFDPWFRSFDMDYSDLLRADRFIAELQRFEREGDMPRLQIVRLPNDHTAGTSAGKLTPTAYVAENDLALGRVIEALSRSRFWPNTAIFVVEDDAQNGPDHVDAHRTVAFVVSPYARRGAVDSTMYSTASMVRTIELILGLQPMSQFDAAALPMHRAFQAQADLRPYVAAPAQVDLKARTPKLAWGSRLSETMNFAREDAADDLLLNEVIWRSVRGPQSPMPAPTRAAFVFAGEGEAERE
jgi:DNA-binding beta-propeller fold protein YncE